MKKLLMGSAVLGIFSLSIALFQISCKKEAVAQTTSLSKEQILVAKTWKIDQLHNVINGTYGLYESGGVNTTGIDYHNTRYTFDSDGTGVYVDEFNTTHSVAWSFPTADQRTIHFSIDGASPNIWRMVEISGNYVHVTENLTIGGDPGNMHSYRLIQIP